MSKSKKVMLSQCEIFSLFVHNNDVYKLLDNDVYKLLDNDVYELLDNSVESRSFKALHVGFIESGFIRLYSTKNYNHTRFTSDQEVYQLTFEV